jgi:2-polyprenyl-3-methyl-5-hydroxy-6-metoxy-1,4-benzoquinol methylase
MKEVDYYSKDEGYFGSVRRDILPMIPPHSNKIMEVGCGDGSTLNCLKNNGQCNWTYGVELFPDAAKIACGRVDKLYQSNIEAMDLPIEASSLDLILCLDVLEHLVNPTKVIKYLHKLLAPNGLMIASIPNVRHFSVVAPLLLQGRWEYQKEGILDSTHLRFFVKDTAIKLMISSGLELEDVRANLGMGQKAKILNAITLGFIPKSFFELQYLIKVRKNF